MVDPDNRVAYSGAVDGYGGHYAISLPGGIIPADRAVANGWRLRGKVAGPGAEPDALATLDLPALIVPGNDAIHTREAAHYLELALPEPELWDALPEEQTAQSAPARVIEFLDRTR